MGIERLLPLPLPSPSPPQVIAFMDALLSHPDSGVKRVAVLSPINAIYNWKKEFEMWIPYFECDYNVSDRSLRTHNSPLEGDMRLEFAPICCS